MANNLWTQKRIDKIFPEIFERISEGESLINVLESNKKFPTARTFLDRVNNNEDLLKQYAQAREIAAIRDISEIERIAREENLFIERKTGENSFGAYSEEKTIDNVQRSRLMIDAIKWKHAHTYKMLGNQNASGDRGGQKYDEEYED